MWKLETRTGYKCGARAQKFSNYKLDKKSDEWTLSASEWQNQNGPLATRRKTLDPATIKYTKPPTQSFYWRLSSEWINYIGADCD
jgi:hypothetical protein